jgi:hypothetical protein
VPIFNVPAFLMAPGSFDCSDESALIEASVAASAFWTFLKNDPDPALVPLDAPVDAPALAPLDPLACDDAPAPDTPDDGPDASACDDVCDAALVAPLVLLEFVLDELVVPPELPVEPCAAVPLDPHAARVITATTESTPTPAMCRRVLETFIAVSP